MGMASINNRLNELPSQLRRVGVGGGDMGGLGGLRGRGRAAEPDPGRSR